MIEFNLSLLQIVTFAVAVISPLLVGLVSTRVTSSAHKAWLLAGLAALTGLGSELVNALTQNEVYDLGTGLITAFTAFIIGVGLHYGLYKPTGTTDKVLESGRTAP